MSLSVGCRSSNSTNNIQRCGVFKAWLIVESVCTGAKKVQTPSDFIAQPRPYNSTEILERDWPVIFIPPLALDGIRCSSWRRLALGRGLSIVGGPGNFGGLADLIPGHQEAELRKRAEADSFPTADKALGTPMVGTGNHSSTGN